MFLYMRKMTSSADFVAATDQKPIRAGLVWLEDAARGHRRTELIHDPAEEGGTTTRIDPWRQMVSQDMTFHFMAMGAAGVADRIISRNWWRCSSRERNRGRDFVLAKQS